MSWGIIYKLDGSSGDGCGGPARLEIGIPVPGLWRISVEEGIEDEDWDKRDILLGKEDIIKLSESLPFTPSRSYQLSVLKRELKAAKSNLFSWFDCCILEAKIEALEGLFK